MSMPVAAPRPNLRQELVQAVDADAVGDAVEIHVAGLRDRRVQVDRAVPALLPVAEAVTRARQLERAAAELRRVLVDDAVLERGQRDQRLDRRAGRVFAAQRAVEQRNVEVFRQSRVLGIREPAREPVRVEGRRADEGQHVAVPRIDRHDGCAPAGERVLGGLLHARVDREIEVLAGHGLATLEIGRGEPDALDAAALGVDQQLLVAGLAVQVVFVGPLDAELADQRRAGIVRRVDALLVLLADGGNVAERMHAGAPERVVTREARPDLDARKVRSVDREPREFFLGQLQPDRHRLETAPRLDRAQHAVVVLGRHQAEADQSVQRVRKIRCQLAGHLQLVRRAIERERHAIAVENQPAARRHRVDADPVALRKIAEVVVLDDLQVHEPREERAEADEDHRRGGEDTPAEQALFGPVVLQAYGA